MKFFLFRIHLRAAENSYTRLGSDKSTSLPSILTLQQQQQQQQQHRVPLQRVPIPRDQEEPLPLLDHHRLPPPLDSGGDSSDPDEGNSRLDDVYPKRWISPPASFGENSHPQARYDPYGRRLPLMPNGKLLLSLDENLTKKIKIISSYTSKNDRRIVLILSAT